MCMHLILSLYLFVSVSAPPPAHRPPHAWQVRVWDLQTLEPLHALKQPAGGRVWSLQAHAGEVWGAVGQEVVVWGRPE